MDEPDCAGLIVDLEKRQVTIYSKRSRNYAISMTLEEFDKHVSTGDKALFYGSTFEPLHYNVQKYEMKNTADASTLDGLVCDRLVIEPAGMIVDHCRAFVTSVTGTR